MNRIDLYASFISEQVYMDEIFDGRDKGYPYSKNNSLGGDYDHTYNIDLPDHVDDAKVNFNHYGRDHLSAEVAFTMPSKGYGVKPDEKKTYRNAFKHHRENNMDGYSDDYAIDAVRNKHGSEAAQRVSDAKRSAQSYGAFNHGSHHAYRVMTTVKKIMDEHGKNHPQIKNFVFTSEEQGDSREKLYKALTIKHGGRHFLDDRGPDHQRVYVIPNPHHKKET